MKNSTSITLMTGMTLESTWAPKHTHKATFWSPLLTQVAAKGSRVFCSQVEVLFCSVE